MTNPLSTSAFKAVFTFLFSFFTIATGFAQTTRYVMQGGSGDGTTSWANASGDLQIIIDASTFGDSIFVAKGIYQPTTGASFSMKEGVKIYGGFTGTETNLSERIIGNTAADSSVLTGNGNSVIYNSTGDLTEAAVLNSFTITGGDGNLNGGGSGMYNALSAPAIINCTFIDNIACTSCYGGAIYNGGGTAVISDCRFSGNMAARGGAIYNTLSSPVIKDCSFSDNWSAQGGAIFNENAGTVIRFCSFTGNSADLAGGAIYNTVSNATIGNCIFIYNTVTDNNYGGAIFNESSSPVITNSVFSVNLAAQGGGICNKLSSPIIRNCSFSGNLSASGGGIFNESSTQIIDNCIIYGNSDGIYDTNGGTSNINYSLIEGLDGSNGTGNLNGSINPLFADAVNNNLELLSSSSCINTGTPDTTGLSVPAQDLAVRPRIIAHRIDMGAYENPFLIPLPVTLIDFTGILNNGIAKLQWEMQETGNINQFSIEKSTDAIRFTDMGTNITKGNNNSYLINTMQKENIAYYRLKMTDINGALSYSKVISLSQRKSSVLSVYPNPVITTVYVDGSTVSLQNLHLINISGQDVTGNVSISHNGNDLWKIDMQKLSNGVYFIKTGTGVYKIIKK